MKLLTVDNVTKRFAGHTAVDRISLEVGRGEIFGLLGANGAGKTTTMRMVLGLIRPDEGRILWEGRGYPDDVSDRIGYLPEERGLYPKVKVSEQLLYLAELRGMPRREVDKRLRVWLDRFGVPEYYDKKVEEPSKGNQQKIQFIAAVLHRPELLILDEVFSGLDPVNVELLKETIKRLRDEGTAILFSSHRMDHVEELCRNILLLHRSKTVLKGDLREIKRSFPQERVVLETDRGVPGLEDVPGVVGVERNENGYAIRIARPEAAQDVLRKAASCANIRRFQIVEPTLNDIFIKTVGGDAA